MDKTPHIHTHTHGMAEAMLQEASTVAKTTFSDRQHHNEVWRNYTDTLVRSFGQAATETEKRHTENLEDMKQELTGHKTTIEEQVGAIETLKREIEVLRSSETLNTGKVQNGSTSFRVVT
jgi:polyhydroxyalkanoate synthesis regulator phasin